MDEKRKNRDFNPNNCGVTHFLNRIGSKWKVLIVYGIGAKVNRFSLLQKRIPDISKQMLVNQLRELEEDGIIYPDYFYRNSAKRCRKIPIMEIKNPILLARNGVFM